MTLRSGVFESHHQYVDIHYLITGAEEIELADEESMVITEAYDEEKDCVFGTAAGERCVIQEKRPFVVMPGEAHVPGLGDGGKRIRKAVVKVLVSETEGKYSCFRRRDHSQKHQGNRECILHNRACLFTWN